jgi:hypothetical protein
MKHDDPNIQHVIQNWGVSANKRVIGDRKIKTLAVDVMMQTGVAKFHVNEKESIWVSCPVMIENIDDIGMSSVLVELIERRHFRLDVLSCK